MPDIDNSIAAKVNPPAAVDPLKTLQGLAGLQQTQEQTGLLQLQQLDKQRELDSYKALQAGDVAKAAALNPNIAKAYQEFDRQKQEYGARDNYAASAAKGDQPSIDKLARFPETAGAVQTAGAATQQNTHARMETLGRLAGSYLSSDQSDGSWQSTLDQAQRTGAITTEERMQYASVPVAKREQMARRLLSGGQAPAQIETLNPQAAAERAAAGVVGNQAGGIGVKPPPLITPNAPVVPPANGAEPAAPAPAPLSQPGALSREANKVTTLNAMTADNAKTVQTYMNDKQNSVDGSQQALKSIEELGSALKTLPTGPGTMTANEVSAVMTKFGVDVNRFVPGDWQTDPAKASIAQKNMEQLAAAWAKGQFPSRITDSDMMIAAKANPNMWNLPQANQILLKNLSEVMRIRLEEAKFMRSEAARMQRTGELPSWEVIDRWHEHLIDMKNISPELRRSFLSESELQRNNQLGKPNTMGLPEGAISAADGPNNSTIYKFRSPAGGFYWGDANGKAVK